MSQLAQQQKRLAIKQARQRCKRARIELTSALRALAILLPGEAAPPAHPQVQLVQGIVAAYFRLQVSELWSPTRTDFLADARHHAMVILRRLTTLNATEIGLGFARNHTILRYALKIHVARCATSIAYCRDYEVLFAQCKAALEGKAA